MVDKKAAAEKKRQEEFHAEWEDNKAKGLTGQGFTKKFDGESRTFYLNGVAITCTIDYDIAPHLEFRSVKDREPNLISETGYRSHFTNIDQKEYDTMEESIEDAVEYIMRNKYMKNSKAKYTLTWEPSLDYLKHSPVQLSLFEPETLDNRDTSDYNNYRKEAVKC